MCVPEKIALKLNFYKWYPISAMIYNTISKILYLHFEVVCLNVFSFRTSLPFISTEDVPVR